MSMKVGFVIRDALDSDIEACLALDHDYETEYVWQMRVQESSDQWQIGFRTERLPRTMTTTYPASADRLRACLPTGQCFVVAAARETGELLGYLAMHNQTTHRIARLHDLVVSGPYRRSRIGSRLLRVARQWATSHDLTRITAEMQTKNYPGIQFFQAARFTFSGYDDHYFANQDIAVFFSQALD